MGDDTDSLLARIDERTELMHEDIKEIKARLNNHGARINSLERWQNWIAGIGSGIAALLGLKIYG